MFERGRVHKISSALSKRLRALQEVVSQSQPGTEHLGGNKDVTFKKSGRKMMFLNVQGKKNPNKQ